MPEYAGCLYCIISSVEKFGRLFILKPSCLSAVYYSPGQIKHGACKVKILPSFHHLIHLFTYLACNIYLNMDSDVEMTDAPPLIEPSPCGFDDLPLEIHEKILDCVFDGWMSRPNTKITARAAETLVMNTIADLALVSRLWKQLVQSRIFRHSMFPLLDQAQTNRRPQSRLSETMTTSTRLGISTAYVHTSPFMYATSRYTPRNGNQCLLSTPRTHATTLQTTTSPQQA